MFSQKYFHFQIYFSLYLIAHPLLPLPPTATYHGSQIADPGSRPSALTLCDLKQKKGSVSKYFGQIVLVSVGG